MEPWTAFAIGVVGSLHCAGMCGPLALALPQGKQSYPGYLAGRFAYNFGRVVTYGTLGLLFGSAGQALVLAGVQRWVSIALGVTVIVSLFASRQLVSWQPTIALVNALKPRLGKLLRQRSLTSLGALGLLNGLLPCGLVYVAAAGATATGHILSGAQYMVLFGLGTVPMMLAISLAGRLVPLALRLKLRKAIPVSVFVVGLLLILRGMSLGIPYVSPVLSGGAHSCCALGN